MPHTRKRPPLAALLIATAALLALPSHGHAEPPSRVAYFTDADLLPTPTDGAKFFRQDAKPPYPRRTPRATLVDLHAHLFEHGLGLASSADFHDPALSAPWDSRSANKVNDAALDASGLGLVVVALYSHPVLSMPAKEGIRRQIHLAEEFVRAHPSWVIARDPKEAARAHDQGKKILVFSLEGAGGILESEDDIREFIDQQGIRIVTFAHLSDDELSGAALMHGYRMLGNPLGLIASLLQGRRGCRGEHLNPNGMTERGRELLHTLLRRGVWIDLAHASEATHAELAPLVKAAGQPLLYTHIMLREHRNSERSISAKQLQDAARSGAVIGLIPGESSIGDAPVPPESCPARCAGRCKGGVFALAAEYNEMARALGPRSVFLGSDFNGAMDHLKPSAPDCALGSTIDARGFSNISQTAELWRDLAEASALSEENEQRGVANFLRAWAKVRPKK